MSDQAQILMHKPNKHRPLKHSQLLGALGKASNLLDKANNQLKRVSKYQTSLVTLALQKNYLKWQESKYLGIIIQDLKNRNTSNNINLKNIINFIAFRSIQEEANKYIKEHGELEVG